MKTKIELDLNEVNDRMKTVFWVTDVIVREASLLLGFLLAVQVAADAAGDEDFTSEARTAVAQFEGLIVAIGIQRNAMTDLRLMLPAAEVNHG